MQFITVIIVKFALKSGCDIISIVSSLLWQHTALHQGHIPTGDIKL